MWSAMSVSVPGRTWEYSRRVVAASAWPSRCHRAAVWMPRVRVRPRPDFGVVSWPAETARTMWSSRPSRSSSRRGLGAGGAAQAAQRVDGEDLLGPGPRQRRAQHPHAAADHRRGGAVVGPAAHRRPQPVWRQGRDPEPTERVTRQRADHRAVTDQGRGSPWVVGLDPRREQLGHGEAARGRQGWVELVLRDQQDAAGVDLCLGAVHGDRQLAGSARRGVRGGGLTDLPDSGSAFALGARASSSATPGWQGARWVR